jgi:hypothetical protein
VVLALHRSARSDLFFEGVVTDSGHSSYCKVRFTEGRAKGQSIKVRPPTPSRCVRVCTSAFVSPSPVQTVVHIPQNALVKNPLFGLSLLSRVVEYV